MKPGRKSIFENGTECLVIYTNDYYCDNELPQATYEPDEIDKLCLDLGIKKKSLTEMVSQGYRYATKELWKIFIDDEKEPIRLL